MLRRLLRGGVVLLMALAIAPTAGALNITNIIYVKNGTGDSTVNTGQNHSDTRSTLGTVQAPVAAPDTFGSVTELIARYAMIVALDRQNTTGTATNTMNSSYSITFTVDNPAGETVQIDIDTLRIGALTNITDSTGNSTITLGAIAGQLDSGSGLAAEPGFTMSSATLTAAGNEGDLNSAFNQTGASTVTIVTNALTSTYILQFDYTSSVTSTWDEGAIRMGIAGNIATATADDYPGATFPRSPTTDDGHFVDVTATIISAPEPAPSALIGRGLVGLALRARRASR
jgi:hypothetical protein